MGEDQRRKRSSRNAGVRLLYRSPPPLRSFSQDTCESEQQRHEGVGKILGECNAKGVRPCHGEQLYNAIDNDYHSRGFPLRALTSQSYALGMSWTTELIVLFTRSHGHVNTELQGYQVGHSGLASLTQRFCRKRIVDRKKLEQSIPRGKRVENKCSCCFLRNPTNRSK